MSYKYNKMLRESIRWHFMQCLDKRFFRTNSSKEHVIDNLRSRLLTISKDRLKGVPKLTCDIKSFCDMARVVVDETEKIDSCLDEIEQRELTKLLIKEREKEKC